MIPSAETLLQFYYATPWVFVATCFAFLCLFTYIGGFWIGYNRALKYVWTNGLEHSKREHRKLFVRWENKIDD